MLLRPWKVAATTLLVLLERRQLALYLSVDEADPGSENDLG